MNPLDKLIAHFEKFPGTGIRQAKRFAFHVLTMRPDQVSELASLITTLSDSVTECTRCHRFFSESGQRQPTCTICRDQNRDQSKLLIVARDSDIEAIERSGVYTGLYFILGGMVPLLASAKDEQRVRSHALKASVAKRLEQHEFSEIILAFAVSPDGENTARFVVSTLNETLTGKNVTISHLGRGLSTGSELEYADSETIKNALVHRSSN